MCNRIIAEHTQNQNNMLKKQGVQDLMLNSELGNMHEWGASTYDGSNRKAEGMKRADY